MKKVLIVGVNGFSGVHLYRHLKKVGNKSIAGTFHQKMNAEKKKMLFGCRLYKCDVGHQNEIRKVLRSVKPDEIYYLSALVTVAGSFSQAKKIHRTNVNGYANFLAAVFESGLRPKILLAGSAEEYGKVRPSQLPIKESQPLSPVNPYGVSKRMQEQLSWYCAGQYGLKINVARTFHFSGPMQPETFVVSDFAKQIAQIEKGQRKPVISVGNLGAKRDFTDIRDVVRAYHLIMKKVRAPAVFNVCRGRSVMIGSILRKLLSTSKSKIQIRKDPRKMRKVDVPDFRGNNQKLKRRTGWKPRYDLDKMLDDVLNYHRKKV